MVEEKLDRVVHHQKIKMMRGARVQDLTLSEDFSVNLVKKPVFIDPEKCSNLLSVLRNALKRVPS